MSQKKKEKKEKAAAPADPPQYDEAAAAGMAADVAAASETREAGKRTEPDSLRAELEEAKDRALRSQAELENYRKRVARDVQTERRYANLPLMREMLPVLDNMARAIEAAEQTHDVDGLLQGVKMVAQQLQGVLENRDCVKIEALGGPFDPHLHEAVSQQPSDEHRPGTVLQVIQTGFQLHDRVVRPAQVIVSTESPSRGQETAGQQAEAEPPGQLRQQEESDPPQKQG